MGEFSGRMPKEQVARVLERYELPLIRGTEAGTGTASPKVIVATTRGRFVLRRRRREFSAPEVVAFDHSVVGHLAGCGIPVACPLRTREGESAVFFGGWAFEVVPFIEGLARFQQDNGRQVWAAAKMLARIHRCTERFEPAGWKDWVREMHAGRNARTLAERLRAWRSEAADGEGRAQAGRMLALLEATARALTDERVAALPHCVVHGDYTSANVFFHGDAVAAVLDFDWTYRQARLDDVGRALVYFAFRRREAIDEGSIWSLVQAWEGDAARARRFLAAYGKGVALTPDEWETLPWFVMELALSMRVRAMRKVPDGEKMRILTFDMGPVLDWLEDGVGSLSRAGRGG